MHTKHGFKEKLKYMKMLERGFTIDYIKKHYGINDTQLNVMWLKYQAEGSSALQDRKAQNRSIEEKLSAIDDYQNKHLPLTEVCLKYDIDKSTVQRWCQRYRLSGPTALITGVDKANVKSYMGRPKKTSEQMTEFERLQKENQELKTEIALLKKMRALVEERNARLYEIGHKPSKD